MVKQLFCLAMVSLLSVGSAVLAQQAAAPLGPLGVPVGATGGLNEWCGQEGCHATRLLHCSKEYRLASLRARAQHRRIGIGGW